ncbi:MAG: Holliday junction branch migration protein RuvA [Candidatus Shapirobacteria bacterium]|jgi:Holliday junction DNA helicase RuvA
MIGSLRGTVLEITPTDLLLEVADVGYRVIAAPGTLAKYRAQETCFLYIHDHIREDAHDLYGFTIKDEMTLFERLIGVSGVGPKVGLAILSLGSAETVKRAIMAGDLGTLTSVSGVGTKIAQKVILELKGQLVDLESATGPDREVIDALVSLGYSVSQAKDAVKGVSPEVTDVSLRVKEALRRLSK